MNIALLTWFHNLNYGTVLQLSAMHDYLVQQYGATVEIINYLPDESHAVPKKETLSDRPFYRLAQAVRKKITPEAPPVEAGLTEAQATAFKEKQRRFNAFLHRFSFTEEVRTMDELTALSHRYDLIVCGSDQIWNPRILSSVYYLSFAEQTPRLSYATSLGVDYIPRYAKARIANYLKDFRAVSLRESTCKDALEAICGKEVSVVCDPTLLLSREAWERLCRNDAVPDKPYWLNYYLGDSPRHEEAYEAAAKSPTEAFVLPSTHRALQRSNETALACGPEDFLSLVKNAEFVLTDSFHAVCFSLIFEKPFCVVYKHSPHDPFHQNSRITDLLQRLGLEDRIAANAADATRIINTPMNYESIRKAIARFIADSENYLKENIY